MKVRSSIMFLAALLILGGCTIEPPLHLRDVAATKVTLEASVKAEFMWQVDWKSKWQYAWQEDAQGPLGYTQPQGIRMHVYTLDDARQPKSHTIYNFSGLSGQMDIFVGVHDLLFHNNDSEALLFRSESELSDLYSYTRVLSSGLKSSSLVKTISQKAAATKADSEEEIDEPVCLMPDQLFSLYDYAHRITDNLEDYEYIDGQYVIRIEGELRPLTYIYLFQVKLLNNYGRVSGSMGGAALTGMAESVNMRSAENSSETVSVPMDVHINTAADPDMLGARVLTFGIPGCNPYEASSLATAPDGKHYFVLNVTFKTGHYKNIRIDVTDQIRALPTGGVITLELDVEDFPPEDIDPPISNGGGFDPLINDWGDETGHTTITN
ncbi:MAG: DUF5119 domain-containing protein [Bacteroidales bacterium]|nr:DUF5119 domain-containing protein [Bacteroidales bacterium]